MNLDKLIGRKIRFRSAASLCTVIGYYQKYDEQDIPYTCLITEDVAGTLQHTDVGEIYHLVPEESK